jgi:selenocysteine lyase/cysteine desulfurase
MDKRSFIKNTSYLLGFSPLLSTISLEEVEEDQYFDQSDTKKWQQVRKDYKLNKFINLENGYYCITPQPVLKKFYNHIDRVNTLGSYYMRTEQVDNKNNIKNRLAQVMGCNGEELAITRNTTESLDIIIGGFHWQNGDEAIMANQDYGAMLNMFNQVSKRNGVVNKMIDIPLDPSSDEEIVQIYEKAITSKTKMILVPHMVNITGHILPVRKISDMAHKYGVKVLVDGAHCVAHFDFKIDDLHCDYYGASLHKWLSNPLGAGLLYVKKEHIPNIWPLLASWESDRQKIQSITHTGTLPVYTDLAINDSIDYYLSIGKKEKEDRLRLLQNYWVDQVRDFPNVIINTPRDKSRSCGIANVGLKNMKPSDLSKNLYEKYNIYTVAIDSVGVHGCRITPNIYTTFKELDVFVKAIKELAV